MFIFSLFVTSLVFPQKSLAQMRRFSGYAQALDGDSLRLNGKSLRIVGIDAFELSQKCASFACGKKAHQALIRLTKHKKISCKSYERDRYGRFLARCFDEAGKDLGEEIIKQGLAIPYGPYQGVYVKTYLRAKSQRQGAHATRFVDPALYRHRYPAKN